MFYFVVVTISVSFTLPMMFDSVLNNLVAKFVLKNFVHLIDIKLDTFVPCYSILLANFKFIIKHINTHCEKHFYFNCCIHWFNMALS